jgi:hypothetical protein
MRARRRTDRQVTVDDIAKLYDALLRAQNKRYYRRWDMNTSHMGRRKNRQIVQDDVRLKRIKDRAEGIRFALGHEDLAMRQRKELEQTLRNLELAAAEIERQLRK